MLRLFRTNQLLFSFLLLFYVGLLHIGAFVAPADWQPTGHGVLSTWLYTFLEPTGVAARVAAIVLLFGQAIGVNVLVADHRLAESVTLLPGVFYILIASLLPEFLHLSPLHLANTFYLIALFELFRVYKKPDCAAAIFNVGFWLAVGSLFYPSYLLMIAFGLSVLNILRAYKIREWLMLLTGAVTPFLLLGVYFFWNDQLDVFWQTQFVTNFAMLDFVPYDDYLVYFQMAFFDLFLLIVIFSYGLYVFKKVMQVQKKISGLYWGLFFGGLTLFLQASLQLDHLLVLALPLGILISFNFQSIAERWAETLHLLILAVVLFFQYQEWLLPV